MNSVQNIVVLFLYNFKGIGQNDIVGAYSFKKKKKRPKRCCFGLFLPSSPLFWSFLTWDHSQSCLSLNRDGEMKKKKKKNRVKIGFGYVLGYQQYGFGFVYVFCWLNWSFGWYLMIYVFKINKWLLNLIILYKNIYLN